MDYDNLNGFAIRNVGQINVILGKNGCGKSHLLKQAEASLRNHNVGRVRYLSPERAGSLQYDPNVENNITTSPGWMDDTRRRNQAQQFKQQSAVLFRRLEMLFLRELQDDHTRPGYLPRHFNDVIAKINTLLDRVAIRTSKTGFEIYDKTSNQIATPESISSGESELISLAIEFLAFTKECDANKVNFLLIDEPDVHLHPDLQYRLALFICQEITAENLIIILATHSTALLSSLSQLDEPKVALMRRGQQELLFKDVSDIMERVLPMFGAHPLSNIFNEAPILLVEGEDDERIWQQAVRSSEGAIRLYPCVTDSVDRQNVFETQANDIIQAVYDGAQGYSLRDRDSQPEDINDIGSIVRMRLSCRTAENLMLSDDALAAANTNWNDFQAKIKQFVEESPHHPFHMAAEKFVDSGLDRKNAGIKDIRNVLVGLMTNKPWEVLVGQAIARIATGDRLHGEHSLAAYLGTKVCNHLLRIQPA